MTVQACASRLKHQRQRDNLSSMNALSSPAFASELLPSVMAAGRAIMTVFAQDVSVETKPDGSPVTAADRLAEEIILSALAKLAPGVPVIAEERASLGELAEIGDAFFLVDPLDGTREFAARRPEFTINVALISDRVPVFGMIYAPANGQLYWTRTGREAFEAAVSPQSGIADIGKLAARPLKTRPPAQSALTIVASRSHGSEELDKWLSGVDAGARTNIGSSLKFCLVANGSADIYPRFGPTREWDTAAGHAIVSAAGGVVTSIDTSPFLYGKAAAAFLNPGFIAWSGPEMVEAYSSGRLLRKA